MQDWHQLPLIINQTSKMKYNSISEYQPAIGKQVPRYQQNKHKRSSPFLCLAKIPVNAVNPPATMKSHYFKTNLQSVVSLDQSVELANTQFSNYHKSLPPIKPAQPKGLISTAFQQIKACLGTYKESESDYFREQVRWLSELRFRTYSQIVEKVGQIRKKDIIFLDPLVKILFHSIEAEISLRENRWDDAINCFKKAEHYSRKIKQLIYTTYCLIQQSDVHRSQSNLQKSLKCLKRALALSAHIDDTQIAVQVLQKIGMLYYYNGNTPMGEHYHRLSQKGLSDHQLELLRKEYKHSSQLIKLQKQLFGLTTATQSPQQTSREARQVNNEVQSQEVQHQQRSHLDMVKQMLQNSDEKKTGLMLRKHIRSTLSLASIIPHANSPPKDQSNNELNLLVNSSQVLKSHLSRNRGGVRVGRQWQWGRLIQMVDDCASLFDLV